MTTTPPKVRPQKYELVSVSQLQPHPRNPRRGDVDSIVESIQANQFYGACVVQRSTGYVLAGNHRLMAAIRAGLTAVPVIWIDCDDDEALRLLLVDNRTNDLASYDDEQLADLLLEIRRDQESLAGTGYDEDALNQLLAELGRDSEFSSGLTPEDAMPPLQEAAVSKLGDLWLLGPHRVLCGDATNSADVARLLGTMRPQLMVTDPPYGVEYQPEWRAEAGVNKNLAKMGKVSNDDRADWREAWALFPGTVAYVWHAGLKASEVQASLEATGFVMISQIIWAKDRFALSRGDYHWHHEPCWYTVRKGHEHLWNGARDQSTLWTIPRADDSGHGHGTQKPVECMRRPMLNNSCPGQVVYDPFLGSGSSIIAADSVGRVCLGLELEPRYVDLIVRRWQEHVGTQAMLDGDGRTFDKIAAARVGSVLQKSHGVKATNDPPAEEVETLNRME